VTQGAAGAQIQAAFVAWRSSGGPANGVINPARHHAIDF
jgi:hypothetical protein